MDKNKVIADLIRNQDNYLKTDPDLSKKVIAAAEEIGIPEVSVVEDKTYAHKAIFRQTKYVQTKGRDQCKDVGYLVWRQFHYNPLAFTKPRMKQFLEALRKRGVKLYPYDHHIGHFLAVEPWEIEQWKKKDERAFYR